MGNSAIILVVLLAAVCIVAAVLWARRGKKPAAPAQADRAACAAVAGPLLAAMGGKDNILKVDHCTTRLRFEVKSYAAVNEAAVKAAGASGVVRPAKNSCQVLLDASAPAVYEELKKLL